MFSRKKDTPLIPAVAAAQSSQAPSRNSASLTIISSDVTFTGNLVSLGDVQIEGAINGNLRAKSVVVGTEANIHGEITADEVFVRGYVKGEIRGNQVTLSPGCLVIGDIFHQVITIETGADFDGRCSRCEDPLAITSDYQKIDEHHETRDEQTANSIQAETLQAETLQVEPVQTGPVPREVDSFSPAVACAEIASAWAPAPFPEQQNDDIADIRHTDEVVDEGHPSGSNKQLSPNQPAKKSRRRIIGTHLAPKAAYPKSSTG